MKYLLTICKPTIPPTYKVFNCCHCWALNRRLSSACPRNLQRLLTLNCLLSRRTPWKKVKLHWYTKVSSNVVWLCFATMICAVLSSVEEHLQSHNWRYASLLPENKWLFTSREIWNTNYEQYPHSHCKCKCWLLNKLFVLHIHSCILLFGFGSTFRFNWKNKKKHPRK